MQNITKILVIMLLFLQSWSGFANQENGCVDDGLKRILRDGWYEWPPYQFEQNSKYGLVITGLDVELTKALASRIGFTLSYQKLSWNQHKEMVKRGQIDIASGSTYTDARSEYAYFSTTYRFEDNALFVLRDSNKRLNFKNIDECLAQLRLQNFKLGVVGGVAYADKKMNTFIRNPENKDIVFSYDNDLQSLQALVNRKIDGFITDRISGAAVIFNSGSNNIQEILLNIKTPIYLMFSKKSVPPETVDYFNKEIASFLVSDEYKNIMKKYLYPVLLMQTIDSEWFYLVGLIGTIAFAISGVLIAAQENSTLFATFLMALLPSVGGGIIRDLMIQRESIGFIMTPSYLYYILVIVLLGFATIRLLSRYNNAAHEDRAFIPTLDHLLVISDAIGQAAFVVIGVSVVVMTKIEPIILWGPFFAFLTCDVGSIFRDLLRKEKEITCVSGAIKAEISIIWGMIFSIFLDYYAYAPRADYIEYAVILVTIGVFLTKLAVFYFRIPNLRATN